ncbi:MAG: glycosyltransferase family 39 protein [Candidatus Thorarchaeota archaeon]
MSGISTVDVKNFEDEKSEWFLVRFIKHHREDLLLLTFAIIVTISSCVYYLITMLTISDPGLTLDDSWIHIQFAHTIFEGNPWEYSPGYPSTGSTSPLWSVILSSIFFFTSDQFGIVWCTYIISTTFFIGCTYLAGRIVTNYLEDPRWGYLTMGAFVLIPRNTWLMLSGMESPLFVFILLLSIWLLDKQEMKYDLVLGAVAGLAYLSRPEGILIALCIPIRFLIIAVRREASWKRFGLFILSGIFAILVAAPWILHCLSTTGYPLPDTFYAKVHIPEAWEIEAWDCHWNHILFSIPCVPIAIFLGVILVIKGKPFVWILPVTLTVLYRMLTPYAAVINNYRYLVPVIDLFLIAAVVSGALCLRLIFKKVGEANFERELNFVSLLVVAMILIIPMMPNYIYHATNFGKAAGNINDMQVDIGHWLNENTPPDSVFATHDAGALRFFSERTMIDLAGLVSPDIIHGNMTDAEIVQYLYDHDCNYFVYFDSIFLWWTQFFPSNAYSKIYTVILPENVICGRDTMSVFEIHWELTTYPSNSS